MELFRKRENQIYLIIWLLILALTAFNLHNKPNFEWGRLIVEWVRLLPFFTVFLINNLFLAPKYLLKKRNTSYFIYLSLIIVFCAYLFDFSRIIADSFEASKPNAVSNRNTLRLGITSSFAHSRILDCVIFSYLVVGVNMAVMLIFKREEEEKKIEETQKLFYETELNFLRQQVSPHFFMNTLNNIHGLIELDQNQAKGAIIELSKLMRYLLEESSGGMSTIKTEFDFLHSYIDLMRLRCSDKVNIVVQLEDSEQKIPPLLFISLVENAFKYGVSYVHPASIFIEGKTEGGYLVFKVVNSSFKNLEDRSTGIGLQNLKKQLGLLFDQNYTLDISERGNLHSVILKIPVYED